MPRVIVGSILDAQADVLVNPANSFLRHGGGLAKIIADAAAPKNAWPDGHSTHKVCDDVGKAWWDEQFKHPSIAVGDCGVTSAGHLGFAAILHAVGPIWTGGTRYERELLHCCVRSIANHCVVRGWQTIACPAISCGLFRFPVDEAAGILLTSAQRYEAADGISFTFYVMPEHAQAFGA